MTCNRLLHTVDWPKLAGSVGRFADVSLRNPLAAITSNASNLFAFRIGKLLVVAVVCTCLSAVEVFAQIPYDYRPIAIPDSSASVAYHISDNGTISGRVDDLDGTSRGYVYKPDGTLERFAGIDGQSAYTELWATNDANQSVGYVSNSDFSQFDAFRRESDGTLVSVNYLAAPGPSNFAVDVNAGGDALVQGDGLTFLHAVDGSQQTLSVDGYSTNAGWGLNDTGTVVGVAWPGFFDTPNGLIYDLNDDSFEIWNYPEAAETNLHDINNEGVIVGSAVLQFGEPEQAFIRHADGTLQFIEFPDAISTRLWGINGSGVISGRYIDANDVSHSFYAVPIPEPNSLLIAALGVFVTGAVLRRSGRK